MTLAATTGHFTYGILCMDLHIHVQVPDPDRNPYADWQPPQLAENQIMDEHGVIWHVDPGALFSSSLRVTLRRSSVYL